MIMISPSELRKRLLILCIGLLLLAALLMARYGVLQIDQKDYWSDKADRQHFLSIQEPFIRGTIYSNPALHPGHPNQAHTLAWDIPKWNLCADPQALPSMCQGEIAQSLALRLCLPPSHKQHIMTQLCKKSRHRRLVVALSSSTKAQLLSWWIPFARARRIPPNGLFFIGDYQRMHPYGSFLGQVLQTVHHQRDETTGQATPTGGLEFSLNRFLRGQKGVRRLMRSPKHHLEANRLLTAPKNGSNVYLTINHVLQAIAEEELAEAVTTLKAKFGWAVMMDPYTGAIWALAQYPFFYPDQYSKTFQDPLLIQNIPIKALSDAHEPGSVMKPITISIALLANQTLQERGEAPLFDPEEKMPTRDGRFPGRKPLREVTYHDFLNMNMALQRSSNIYMARLIQRVIDRLGAPWYRNVLHEVFGFGKKTGIELPGESNGVLPEIGKQHANGTLEWSVPTPFSMAIGHNVQATSMQLLRIYAMLANGGSPVRPTLIHSITEKGLSVTTSLIPNKKDLPPPRYGAIMKRVVQAMRYATKRGGGAWRADIPGYTEAGKSGTAEKIIKGAYSRKDHVSTFIGFTPADNPRLVLLVTIDEPEYAIVDGIRRHMAGYTSAPVFSKIAARSLAYLGVEPDDPYGYPPGDPRSNPAKADWVPEMRALEKLYKEWNHKK